KPEWPPATSPGAADRTGDPLAGHDQRRRDLRSMAQAAAAASATNAMIAPRTHAIAARTRPIQNFPPRRSRSMLSGFVELMGQCSRVLRRPVSPKRDDGAKPGPETWPSGSRPDRSARPRARGRAGSAPRSSGDDRQGELLTADDPHRRADRGALLALRLPQLAVDAHLAARAALDHDVGGLSHQRLDSRLRPPPAGQPAPPDDLADLADRAEHQHDDVGRMRQHEGEDDGERQDHVG